MIMIPKAISIPIKRTGSKPGSAPVLVSVLDPVGIIAIVGVKLIVTNNNKFKNMAK